MATEQKSGLPRLRICPETGFGNSFFSFLQKIGKRMKLIEIFQSEYAGGMVVLRRTILDEGGHYKLLCPDDSAELSLAHAKVAFLGSVSL